MTTADAHVLAARLRLLEVPVGSTVQLEEYGVHPVDGTTIQTVDLPKIEQRAAGPEVTGVLLLAFRRDPAGWTRLP